MFNRQSLHIALLLWGCIFSLIAALCMFMSKNFDKHKRRWLLVTLCNCAALLCSDAIAWGARGVSGSTGYATVVISNFLVFALSDILLMTYHGYLCCCLYQEKRRRPVKRVYAVYVIAAAALFLVVLSQFTNLYYYIDADNFYHRNPGHVLSMILPMIGMLVDLSLIIEERRNISRRLFVSLISYMILPILADSVQIFYYGISLTNIAISISMILLFVVAMIEQNENLAKKQKEAADLRISVMISQIAPHFIYNALTSIQEMCDTDPKEAGETIGEFAEYLRGNLESLNLDGPIPFGRELRHVQTYLAIEKKRFGDRVNVVYDIEDDEFLLPALALQPLVENAVKHGICKKKGGGTITIQTRREEGRIRIIVSDDGIGFDMQKVKAEDKMHIGIENTKKRLQDMCGGTLSLQSTPGSGTRAVILLPQE